MTTNFSPIIAGTMHWGEWRAKFTTAQMMQLIHDCISHGITSFDHADIYGGYTTEAEFGKAFSQSGIERESIQIITKCGIQHVLGNRVNKMGLNDRTSYYPLEEVIIRFHDNGYYKIESNLLFDPPQYNRKMMYHIYNSNLALIDKLSKGMELSASEQRDIENLPSTLMICHLNGFEEAKQKLADAKPYLKDYPKPSVYLSFKEAMRVLRKMKYNSVN